MTEILEQLSSRFGGLTVNVTDNTITGTSPFGGVPPIVFTAVPSLADFDLPPPQATRPEAARPSSSRATPERRAVGRRGRRAVRAAGDGAAVTALTMTDAAGGAAEARLPDG